MIYNDTFIKQFANPLSLFADSPKKNGTFFYERLFHHILIWLLAAKNLNGTSFKLDIHSHNKPTQTWALELGIFRKLTSYPPKNQSSLNFLFLSSSKVKRSYPIPSRSDQYPPTQLYSYNLGNRYNYSRIHFLLFSKFTCNPMDVA